MAQNPQTTGTTAYRWASYQFAFQKRYRTTNWNAIRYQVAPSRLQMEKLSFALTQAIDAITHQTACDQNGSCSGNQMRRRRWRRRRTFRQNTQSTSQHGK